MLVVVQELMARYPLHIAARVPEGVLGSEGHLHSERSESRFHEGYLGTCNLNAKLWYTYQAGGGALTMPGARPSKFKTAPESSTPDPKPPTRVFKRMGPVSEVEVGFIKQFLQDQPREITPTQEKALSKVMRRSKEVIRNIIEQAREEFQGSALDYVNIHKEATIAALEHGDNEVAIKSAQWAITNMSQEGTRVVEKVAAEGGGGVKIMIGVQMGGIDKPKALGPVITEIK